MDKYEEAIQFLSEDFFGMCNCTKCKQDNEYINLAIEALREKMERENGCMCYDGAQLRELLSCGATYCSQCGCKLKGEENA
jgi:hypothetical protein